MYDKMLFLQTAYLQMMRFNNPCDGKKNGHLYWVTGLQKMYKAWLNLKTLIFHCGNWIVFGAISVQSNSEERFITMPISGHTQLAKSILFDMWHVTSICEWLLFHLWVCLRCGGWQARMVQEPQGREGGSVYVLGTRAVVLISPQAW